MIHVEALMREGEVVDLLAELIDRPAWMADALCKEPAYAEVSFFPASGESLEPARAICGRCLVQAECRTYAVETDERHGMWGGTSPGGRKALRGTPEAA